MRATAMIRTEARYLGRHRGGIEPLERRHLLTAVVVNTLADEIYPQSTGLISLRSAIIVANASTTPTSISFDPTVFATPQTILLTSTLSLTGGEPTTITGPAAQLTLSGGGGNFDILDAGQDVSVDYSGFTVADGKFGIGIEGNSTLENLIVTGNSQSGISCGGIQNETSVFTNVSAINNGEDGITNNGTLTLNNVIASNNGVDGINNNQTGLFYEGDLIASNVTAQNNDGRGINNANFTESLITNSVMSENSGGGFENAGTATLQNDTIANNSAKTGGGILNTAAADSGRGGDAGGLTLINDTIASNSVTSSVEIVAQGGGIFNNGIITVEDTTITGNSSQVSGGGVFNSSPLAFTMSNTIVAQNSIASGGGGSGPDFAGDVTSVGYNLIGETDGGGPWLPADLIGTAAQPLSPELGTLADNGGASDTLLPLLGSPAIDHGSNALVPAGVTTDQRGLARIYDGTVDIGSVEAQAAAGAAIVVSAPASQEAALNVSQSFSLGSFTETNTTGPYTVAVSWGDESPILTLTASAPGTIGPESHAYTAGGTDKVTVTVTDSSGFITADAAFAVTVASLALTPAPAQTAFIETTQSFALGSFTETGGTSPYSVSVNWGDGTANTVFTQAGTGTILPAPHIFAASGTLAVTETVTDARGKDFGSGKFNVTVTAGIVSSSVALQVSSGVAAFGSPVILTASVSPPNATGIVTFLANGGVIGTADIGAGGIAVLTTTALGAGTSVITVSYGGSSIYAASISSGIDVVVATPPVSTTLSLQISSESINASESVTLTAALTPFSVGGVAATGTISFYEAGITLGTASVQSGGIAVLVTTTGLPVGSDAITAVYGGDAHFLGSTAPDVAVIVVQAASRIVLAVSSPSMTATQAGTLTATIQPAALSASTLGTLGTSGTVTFIDGGNIIGTAAVASDGVATLVLASQLPEGIDAVVAVYSGAASFQASTSAGTFVDVTAHALVPDVRKIVVPASVIGGVPFRGSVSTQITNELSNVEAGPETGYALIRVYAALSGTIDVDNASLVGTILKKVSIKDGRSIRVSVPLTRFSPSLPSGVYQLLVQTTDSEGNIEVVESGTSVSVTAPSVQLSGSFVSVPSNPFAKGAVVSLTTSGNVSDLSAFTAKIGLSTDAAGQSLAAEGTGTVSPARILVRVGHNTMVRVGGWRAVAGGVTAGSYYLTLTLTDAAGHLVSIISSKPVTL